jgi:hypothetical protein
LVAAHERRQMHRRTIFAVTLGTAISSAAAGHPGPCEARPPGQLPAGASGPLVRGWLARAPAGATDPAAFDGVRCLVSPQPVTPRYIVERRLAVIGLGGRLDDFDTLLRLRTSVGLDRRIPQEWAKDVRVPTFLYQVRGDTLTDPSDVQAMYDNIPVADKKLQWIEGTTARWDGYLEFQRRPQPMLDWFARYI